MGTKRVRTNAYPKRARRGTTSRSRGAGYPRRATSRVSRIPNPITMPKGAAFPMRLQNQMRYSTPVTITADAAGNGVHVFSCNGLYDPDITSIGHQPLYFDQLMGIYNHYKVVKSYMKITPVNNSQNLPLVLCLHVDDNGIKSTGYPEGADSKNYVLNPAQGHHPTMYLSWTAQATFGGNGIDNDQLQGDVSNNPVEQSYFMLNIRDAAGNSTTDFYVDLYFTTIFDELKSVTQS